MTNQPAAFESVLDSIRGVVTQGFLFFEGAMLVMAYEVGLLRIEEAMIQRKERCCCRSLG
jgi:ribose 5-phosphate isomerase